MTMPTLLVLVLCSYSGRDYTTKSLLKFEEVSPLLNRKKYLIIKFFLFEDYVTCQIVK
jgi:hypothetical protein